jgi:2-polyprenyl-3-methyl-5-hydroxy-6-metoxy-1,4-benzoquinol methylase
MPNNNSNCIICHTANSNSFVVKEMMFGLREEFNYVLCENCGVIYQIDPPSDLSPYYSSDYYSLQNINQVSGIELVLKRMRGKFLFKNKWFFPGWILSILFGKPGFSEYFRQLKINFNDNILDVGSGSGFLLQELFASGFNRLSGIDPFISTDIKSANGVNVYKKSLEEIKEIYDVLILNHSFEHMNNHSLVLQQLNKNLLLNGLIIIRVPVVNDAWKKFGANWVQLDAPRHTCVFSEKAILLLAEQSGFKVEKIIYDSTAFQFWGSEQYQKNIPLRANNSYAENPKASIFKESQIKQYEKEAEVLNKSEKGDQACFCLRKVKELN